MPHAEQLVDVLSTLNEHDQPHHGTCTMVLGDGTVKVQFANGRARVPVHVARLLADHPHVSIPALDGTPAPAPKVEEPEPEVEAPVEEPEAEADAPAEPEVSDEVRVAMEHLAAEGEDVPEPEPVRDGFEPLTADGQAPRCQAAKGDGTQCANPATEGQACRLDKHQEQLAA